MITFEHYMEFSKQFEDVLLKMKEDGKIFNTKTFGLMEELITKWIKENKMTINSDDLRVLTTYLTTNILKPEDYFKELRFLHEEIRLRQLVKHFTICSPLMSILVYASHYILNDPKKGFNDEFFIKGIIKSINKNLNKNNISNILANLKAENYKDLELDKFLKELKGMSKIL